MNCRSTSTFPINGEAIALAQRHNKISTFFRSPLENGKSSGYYKRIGLEPPDSQAAVVPSNGTLPIFSCKRFILACGAVFGQARLVTRGSTPQAFFVALNRQQKRNTKMFANHKEAKA